MFPAASRALTVKVYRCWRDSPPTVADVPETVSTLVRTAVDVVRRDAHVVGRGVPREGHAGGRLAGGGQPGRARWAPGCPSRRTAAGPVQADVVGVVGALGVPAVDVDRGAGLRGAGREGRRTAGCTPTGTSSRWRRRRSRRGRRSEPRTQPLSEYVVFGWTATVWLHCALSLELTAPCKGLGAPVHGGGDDRAEVAGAGPGGEAARLEAGVGQDVGRLGRTGQSDGPGESECGGAEQCEEPTSVTSE